MVTPVFDHWVTPVFDHWVVFALDHWVISALHDDRFYIALFFTLEQTHCALVARDSKRATVAFYSAFLISTEQRCLVVTWLVPRGTAAVSARSVHAIQPRTMSRHFMQLSYILCRMQAYLAVTCHLLSWQNDLDLLRATAVTRGRKGYRNKRQHRKLTLEGTRTRKL